MVVVVPALAKGGDGGDGHVMGLHAGAIHLPGLGAPGVSEVGNEPVHGGAGRHPDRHAPHQPRHAADQVKRDADGQLLEHPGLFKELVEAVVGDLRARIEARRMIEHELAVQVVPSVLKQPLAVSEVVVAGRLPL